ncbi:MAG TPA: peptidoglycan DD-metalloendopeptidase family protein, partial [Bacteroidales bacterium]|nr:peptidoglycan DD-metalloendopeptidase family protein [Bacteroidales bacterium]
DFPVKKGDSIAFSGNSGGSQGPHLHFEIRETIKQSPIQPLLFKIPVTDTKAPSFYSLTVYPLARESRVSGATRKITLPTMQSGKNFVLKNDNTIVFKGPIGFGTEVFDAVDSNANRTGFYMLTLKVDSTLIYKNELASFNFGESRYVNSMTDYAEYMKSRKKITKLYIDPNNRLSVYKASVNKGMIDIKDTLVHNVEITAGDSYGNTSSLRFKIRYKDSGGDRVYNDSCIRTFSYLKENVFETDSFRFFVPLNALYNDLCLKYSTRPRKAGYYSRIYQVGDSSIPMQYPFEISIKPSGLSQALMEKALIVRLDNNYANSIGGTFEKGFIKGKTYIMGSFVVTLDTTPPRIFVHKNFSTNYQGIRKSYIAFKISDNLSGISTYNGFIDGKWALFEYDAKDNLLVHQIDETRFQYNSNTSIKIVVTDSKNNSATLETKYKAN